MSKVLRLRLTKTAALIVPGLCLAEEHRRLFRVGYQRPNTGKLPVARAASVAIVKMGHSVMWPRQTDSDLLQT